MNKVLRCVEAMPYVRMKGKFCVGLLFRDWNHSIIFSLEKLGLEVDREYKNLNKWYEKADTFNTWIYFNEKTIDEESSGSSTTNIPVVKEQMEKNQVFYVICGNLFKGAAEYHRKL